MKKILPGILFSMLSTFLFAQTAEWKVLTNPPEAARYDDMSWVTPEIGWTINSSGQIWKTSDGGVNWELQKTISSYLRSIAFSDSLNGWVGTLRGFGSTVDHSLIQPLYFTTDGGKNWNKLDTTLIPNPKPKRICGLSLVGKDIIYGSGAFDGPARIVKSIDGGKTWTSINMSPYAQTLIDIKFFSADTGIVVGGGLSGVFSSSRIPGDNSINSVILYTTDGGLNWTPVYTGNVQGEWGWKIHFVNRKVGFVSLESFTQATVMKTTDGGLTWSRNEVTGNFDIEGVGFITENVGWVGGYGVSSYSTDGGSTWTTFNIGGGGAADAVDEDRVNRFRFFGDTLAYASGRKILKYHKNSSTKITEPKIVEKSLLLLSNYPNPFNPSTTISYQLPKSSDVLITIYNTFGQEIFSSNLGFQNSGNQKFVWNGKDSSGKQVSSGVYFYRIDAGNISDSRSMILMK